MAGNLVTIRIDADAARAIAQINETALAAGRLDAAGKKAGSSFSRTGQTLTQVGSKMTRNLTLPIVLAGGAAVKTAVDFNTSLTHIQALVGASAKQMDQYRQSILDLSPAVGKGPKELADALYFITSSGFKGAAALDVLKNSAQAAAAGLGDTQTIANLVTGAVTAYGEKTLSAAKATDILTATVREGKGDPAQLADALGQNIGIAQQLGVSFDQVGAAMSALTLISPNVAEDATQLSGIMSTLLAPTKQTTDQLKKMGLSADDVRKSVKEKGLLSTLFSLKDGLHGNQDALKQLFPNIRALRGFLALTGEAAKKNVGVFDRLSKSTGDTGAAFDKAGKSAQFQFDQSLAKLQVTGVKVGNDLIPILTQVAGTVSDVASAFDGLSPTMQKVIIDAGLVVAALGPVTTGVGNVSKLIGQFTDQTSGTRKAFSGLQSAMTFLGPGGIVLGAAAAAIPLMLLLGDTTDGVTRSMNSAADAARGLDDALHNQTTANEGAAAAQLDVKDAADALQSAQKDVNKALKEHGKHSESYRDALRAEQRAELNLRVARRRSKDALVASGDATKAVAGASDTLNDRLLAVVKSARTMNARLGESKGGAATAAAGLQGVADSIDARTNPSLKNAISFAAELTRTLNAIPNNITTTITTIQQTTAIETRRAQGRGYVVPHGAMGAIVRRPTLALIGESGPEAVVPLDRTPGNSSLSHGKLGKDVHNHFHFPNAVIVDGEGVKRAAKLVEPHIRNAWARRG